MGFDGFDWDQGNREKCQKHGVSIAEVESLFRGQLLVGPDPSVDEERFRAVGQTVAGRALFVVFTWRTKDGGEFIRPISARNMHRKEIEAYEEDISKL